MIKANIQSNRNATKMAYNAEFTFSAGLLSSSLPLLNHKLHFLCLILSIHVHTNPDNGNFLFPILHNLE